MTDLARHLRGDELPALEAVAFLLSHYGLVEPSPHFFFARAPARGPTPRSGRAPGRSSRWPCAPAPSAGSAWGSTAAARRCTWWPDFKRRRSSSARRSPAASARGGAARVAARIDAAYRDPELVITSPDGRVHEAPPARGRDLSGEVRCDADGRYQLEIVATGAVGPTVLANFPVYCGVSPPVVWQGGVGMQQGSADPVVAEQEIVALVNRDRARAGLPPVTADARLAAIARAHCHDMIDHDFVGHLSPRTGTAMDRVRRAGLKPDIVFENVGRAYSPDQAESGFLGSPGHRGNLLDPRARRIGVGVVFGPEVTGTRPLFVTQLFTS